MRYWFTTHWPRRVNEPADRPHFGVWVPDKKRKIIEPLAPNDLVFIYESKSGRTQIQRNVDGTTRTIRCRCGLGGVVALVQVTEKAYELDDSQKETYTNGTEVWWRYYAPTRSVNSAGFIPRADAATILGFKERYPFRNGRIITSATHWQRALLAREMPVL